MIFEQKTRLTGIVTEVGVKTMELCSIAANSDALLPEARAVRKIVFRRRCSWVWEGENGGFLMEVRAVVRDHPGNRLASGGRSRNWVLASRLNYLEPVLMLKARRSGRAKDAR